MSEEAKNQQDDSPHCPGVEAEKPDWRAMADDMAHCCMRVQLPSEPVEKKNNRNTWIMLAIAVLAVVVFAALYRKSVADENNRQARCALVNLVKARETYRGADVGNFRNIYYGSKPDGSQRQDILKAVADARWVEAEDIPASDIHEQPGPLVPFHGFYFIEDPAADAYYALPEMAGLFDSIYWLNVEDQTARFVHARPARGQTPKRGESLEKIGSPLSRPEEWNRVALD